MPLTWVIASKDKYNLKMEKILPSDPSTTNSLLKAVKLASIKNTFWVIFKDRFKGKTLKNPLNRAKKCCLNFSKKNKKKVENGGAPPPHG